MLYIVGESFEKKSAGIKNCGKWSDILYDIFPNVAVLTSEFGVLQNILSVRVLLLLLILVDRKIWVCNGLEAISS